MATNGPEWDKKEADGRERFTYQTYTIKDQYNGYYYVPAYYISGKGRPCIMNMPVQTIGGGPHAIVRAERT